MTVTWQDAREALQAGVAAKHQQAPWLTYEYVTPAGVRGSYALRVIDGDLTEVHARLEAIRSWRNLPANGWWYCTSGPSR